MAEVWITRRDGSQARITSIPGETLLATIRRSGVVDLLALCGGLGLCATCHVHVHPADIGGLPPMSDRECDMLEGIAHRMAGSRLSCQITPGIKARLIRAVIAPID